MKDRYAVVITTINHPTRAVVDIARDCVRLDAHFVVVGDSKSPPDFHLEGTDYYPISRQRESGLRYAEIVPSRHYALKNIGYLSAIREGATVIVETDDDNIPTDDFWLPRQSSVPSIKLQQTGWINAYAHFTSEFIWPRGLPLPNVRDRFLDLSDRAPETVFCPIQQGLANGDPDVDAIYRLVLPLPLSFEQRTPLALSDGAWCPFNSQNTTWWKDAFPLMYLPYYCSFRMTDIWRSFIAQKIAWLNGWSVLFHNATVFQDRNEHNLMRDFSDEVVGYLNNAAIADMLNALPLRTGVEHIHDNLRAAYLKLIEMKLVGAGEMALLEAWLSDLGKATPV